MVNKKLKISGSGDLKLPSKMDKTAKKPKWQAKNRGKRRKLEPVLKTP